MITKCIYLVVIEGKKGHKILLKYMQKEFSETLKK